MASRLKTYTLGCKVNQYETQLVREGFLKAGFIGASEEQAADICIVNTCTVTSEGDSKSRQMIRRLNRENPDARIVVMGCYATRAPREVAKLPGVVEVVTDKRELPDLLGRHGVIDMPTGIEGLTGRHRAFVKVQDGCLLNCSYCIIPYVRPRMYSRPLVDIVQEVRRLEQNGYREVVLTGIHLGHYGVDFNRGVARSAWTRLATLVQKILLETESIRIRLSSIEATEVTRDLIAVMAAHPTRVCPHLHVCLQSGSDRVLRRMKRRWNAARIIERCRLVTESLDRPAFSTDVIVGFPGESEADFEETLSVCRKIGFMKSHVFPFSPRKGTPAATMSDQVQKATIEKRVQRMLEVDTELRRDYLDRQIGKTLTVMIEQADSSGWSGTSCRFVFCDVRAESPLELGQLVKVVVRSRDNDRLICV